MLLILLIIFLIHFIIFKNKYDLYILSLILLCYLLKNIIPKKETFINFNPDELKEKLVKINSIDELKNKNINEYINLQSNEINSKCNQILSIITDINIKIDDLLNSSILKINNIKDKIKLIASVILVTFKILFNISKKLKDFNNIGNIIKILFYYTIDELRLIDESYQKIKVDWDKCFETNAFSRYVGFNSNCDKALKKTIKLKKSINNLSKKIYEKYDSLDLKVKGKIDLNDLNQLLNSNKDVFKNAIKTFETNGDVNIDLNEISNELEKNKNKILILNK
jgi:hypothetical protein